MIIIGAREELSGVCGSSPVSGLHCKSCRMIMNDLKNFTSSLL
jgi:hypothetical protein